MIIKTRLKEALKKLTGFNSSNSQTVETTGESDKRITIEDLKPLNERIDRIENELLAAVKEFRAHEAIEHPIIVTDSLKHDIGILNSIVKGINTRIDQIENKKSEYSEILSEKELYDLQHLSKETGEYHKLKAKATRIYEKTGFVPPGFMVDAKKKLRRNLNMKGKPKKPIPCNQKEENKKPVTILKEFAFKGREKPDIGILDTPN